MEAELIASLRRRISAHPLLETPVGDDAAVLRTEGISRTVVTVDLLTDRVDFHLDQVDPRRVGHKALAVNLSDLAAMAARPLAGVIAVVLPKENGLELAERIYDGIFPLAERYSLAIAGGDTNSWDGPLAISITLLGAVTEHGPLLRSGAKPGDRILVTGRFGGSILGRHLDVEPRVDEALLLNERYQLHAGIDVSDGLSIDLARLARESGVGVELDLDRVPIADAAVQLSSQRADGVTPLEHALSDGEDFELILTATPEEARKMIEQQPLEVPLTDIGQIIEGSKFWQTDRHFGRQELVPRGWLHD